MVFTSLVLFGWIVDQRFYVTFHIQYGCVVIQKELIFQDRFYLEEQVCQKGEH